MKLLELFNTNVPFTVHADEKRGYFQTQANIGGREIEFEAFKRRSLIIGEENDDVWNVEFFERNKQNKPAYGITGSGKALEVFSFIKDSLDELIHHFDPKELRFSASKFDKPGHAEETNRAALYTRMLNKYYSKKYKFMVVDDDRDFKFMLTRLK